MRGVMIGLASLAVLTGFGAADVKDGVLTVAVESTQDGYTPDQLAAIGGGTVTEIRKTGAGTLVSKGIENYAGKITVAAGVMKVSDATGLGSSAGATVVESGATLHFDSLSSGYTTYKSERYVLSGNGCNASAAVTNGAIRITGATCQLSHLTLSADTAIYSDKGFHFYDDGDSTIDMGGRTLRLYSVNSGNYDVEWKLDGIVKPGHIEAHDARYFRPYSSSMTGGDTHEIRLFGRTGIILDSTDGNQDWKFVRYGAGGFYQGGSGTWNGALENRNPASGFSMYVAAGKNLIFNGPLTGSGNFLKDANLGAVFLNGTNDFTGTFEAKGGKLILGHPEGASDSIADRFNFTSLTVDFGLTAQTENWPEGWSDAQFKTALDAINAAKKDNVSVSLYTIPGDSHVTETTFSADYTPIRIGAIAAGEASYAPVLSSSPKFRVSTDADLVFTRNSAQEGVATLGSSSVIKGFWHFKDAGYVDLGTSSLEVGANRSQDLMGIKVSGNTVLGRSSTGDGSIGLPYSIDGRQVYMEVSGNAIVTNRIQISVGSSASAGAVYQRGGMIVTPYNGTYIGHIGARSDGYIEVSDGQFHVVQNMYLATFQSGCAKVRLSGGNFRVSESAFYVGLAGTGTVYQTAGLADYSNDVYLASSAFENDKSSGYGAYTVSGASAVARSQKAFVLNNRTTATAYLNVLDGGTVEAKDIKKSTSSETAKSYAYLNGGTVRLLADAPALFAKVDRVTVGADGATIDTDGHAVTLATPLSAPAAGGIASIALGGTFENIVSPPTITISGDGEGASAVAEFDSTTRTVTGIRVTSPGSGYTPGGTTVTATYKGYLGTTVACTFALTETTGTAVTLTKKGEGTLTLPEGALPSGSKLSVEGGSVAGAGAVFSEYAADVEKAAAGVCGSVPAWPDNAVLSIAKLNLVDPKVGKYVLLTFSDTAPASVPALADGCTLPDKWILRLQGKKLMLCFRRGLAVIVR